MNRTSLPDRRQVLGLLAGLTALGTLGAAHAAPTDDVGEMPDRTAVKQMVVEEALLTNVPPALALAVAKVESDFHPNALSTTGARGVMQIMPEFARAELGIEPDELWDARLNIQIGLDVLEQLYERHGRWQLALSHYNSGAVLGEGHEARPIPVAERYVDTVLRWQERYEAQSVVWQTLHEREKGWWPARTRTAQGSPGLALPRPEARREPIVRWWNEPARKRAPIVRWQPAGLDDIERRLRLARPHLDDFTPFPPVLRELGW